MDRTKYYTIGIIIILLIIGVNIFYENKIKCYEQYRILTAQYIDSTNSTHGGDCTKGCLFMETIIPKSGGDYGLSDYSDYKKQKLFFANENKLREDLKINSEITIKWCSTPYGDRVRNIK